jgi:archaemetzincin
MKFLWLCFLLILVWQAACLRAEKPPNPTAQKIAQEFGKPELIPIVNAMKAVEPLNTPMLAPLPNDWLASYQEDGQTFTEYLRCNPVLPDEKRKIIYIQPLGIFTESQRKIVTLAADYLSRFYNLPIKFNEDLPLTLIPKQARRKYPFGDHHEQIQTGYVMNELMIPRLADDAVVMLTFTASDLFPDPEWNYVFGMASMKDRVGVWSINRFGDPDKSEEYQQCLIRTLKLASHETGHMFSMPHCTKYECNMSGVNHLSEDDRRPMDACPECMAKICWGLKYDPVQRYQKLSEFFQAQGLLKEQKYYLDALQAVRFSN